ncbi:hypothetical protein AZE42_05376 [Rhizopogon vesiculosus]|uniref:Protein kinase domain-containing protein n=1 Tax=Rhizopogon vesiculosus TaxID=180088 RepID=A0A1J8R4L9_9AGAM|nr:hypothetical protein AZE42_05376 [Rhizopogon vesiculosus]
MCERNSPTDLTGQIFGTINDHVAAGAFGNVYRCEWRRAAGPVKVAVKVIKFHTSEEDLRRLRREAGIWARLVHENIVSLSGTTKGFGPFPALVSLWFPHGTLHCLIADKGDRLNIKSKLNLLHDIASGLHYLHSFPIVHGDITSSNVLVDVKEERYRACLTDFGLSTVLGGFLDDPVEGSTVRYGAIRWIAPELLSLAHDSPDVKPTKQNDMYSFGRIMFHVLTLLTPWNDIDDHQVLHKILRGEEIRRPEMLHATSDITDARWNEIELCWSVDAPARPSALMAMTFLKSELEALTDWDSDVFVDEGQENCQSTSSAKVDAIQMTASGLLRCSSPTEIQDTGSHEHLPYKMYDQTLSSDSVGHGVQPQAGTATMPLSRSSSRTTLARLLSRQTNPSRTSSVTLHSFVTASSLNLTLYSSVGMRERNPPTDLTGQIFGTINDYVTAGAFGNVYRCEWRRAAGPVKVWDVAVKVFHTSDDSEDLRRIRREAGIWAHLVHENIVSLLGITERFGPFPSLVSLWFPHGTLCRLIADKGDRLSVRSKLNLLHDIASGLHYLHSFPIVHGDITSSNILIDIKEGQYKACLTDFGLSTVLGGFLGDHTVEGSTVRHGAIRWAAPELLSLAHDYPDVKPTKQNDIYSFGRVMYHVLTLLIPWNGISDHQVLYKVLCGKEIRRPEIPHATSDITDARWNEIELCWSIDAPTRPSALMVMTFLKSELAALKDDVSSWLVSSLMCTNLPRGKPLSRPLNVLIFGETGVGKSSVINLIVGQEVAQTSPDGPTCTLQHTFYEAILGNQRFKLWEVSSIAPMNFFRRLLTKWRLKSAYKKLCRDDGVYLLLYCMRGSRAQGAWVRDYKYFTSIVSSTTGHVPVAGVVTCLEDYPLDMDEWWKKNGQNLECQGVQFSEHACITSLPNDPAASPALCARRRQSEQTIRSLICDSYQAGRTSFSANQVPTS